VKTIHDQWQDFCDAGGRNLAADEYELHKMRCAFYAGALGVMEAMRDIAQYQKSMDEGQHIFSKMWEECEQFAQTCSAQN
jgi:hypothetical protein